MLVLRHSRHAKSMSIRHHTDHGYDHYKQYHCTLAIVTVICHTSGGGLGEASESSAQGFF